jgi:hypothetical protein
MLAIFILSDGVGLSAMAQPRATNEDHESVEEVVEEHREVIELVAEGDDEPAEWARAWLRAAGER